MIKPRVLTEYDEMMKAAAANKIKLGLIINPWAGIGGSVALKGSDGVASEALARGAEPRAPERARRALAALAPWRDCFYLLGFAGDMGESLARSLGFAYEVIGGAESHPSTGADSRRAAQALLARQVDLLVFAGGDGTARDMADAVGEHLPVLGIPAGVKMHSGVFAITPEAAGEVLARVVSARWLPLVSAEVRDIDEEAFRAGRVKSRHYGDLRVPEAPQQLQGSKNSGVAVDELAQLDIAAECIEQMDSDTLYLVGPGSTTAVLLEQMGLPATLLGVDVVRAGECLKADASADDIRQWLAVHSGPVAIIVTAIGGQGHVFGRGNQQFTPEIIARVGRSGICIIATRDKIRALQGRPLLLDTHDPALDTALAGLYPVITGYRQRILYPLGLMPLSAQAEEGSARD